MPFNTDVILHVLGCSFGGLLLRTTYRFLALARSSRKDTMMSISRREGRQKDTTGEREKHLYARQHKRCRLLNRTKWELEQRVLPRACNSLGSIRGSELREEIGDVFPRG